MSEHTATVPRVGFLMEQALGHVTYTRNLMAAYAGGTRLAPVWMPVPFVADGPLDRLPVTRANWTLRASLRAQAALRAQGGARAFDALFFHTQTVALSAPLVARRTPVIVSLDATPLNFDRVGAQYGHHAVPGSRGERLKQAVYRQVFCAAAALTTWSQWAKDSLRDDYGVDPERITVIAPGVDLDLFAFGARPRPMDGAQPVRILFVGGDIERKGGRDLLACLDGLPAGQWELDLVTPRAVPPRPGVRVHRDLGPNDPRLLALYRDADIFCLPTHADCLAVVLGEAMAAGLPAVTTNVGAQPEAIEDGRNGLIVPPGDVQALGRALRRLMEDGELRRAMGRAGRAIAEMRFDARRNADRLVEVIHGGIARWGRHRANGRTLPAAGRA